MATRRAITKNQKLDILEKRPHCFICELPIAEEDLPQLEFDHIKALGANGPDDLANMAGVHKTCHKGKGTRSLEEFKEELRLNRVFGDVSDYATLAARLNPGGEVLAYDIDYETAQITFADGKVANLHTCPNTGLRYFYHPIEKKYIQSDVEVQPRGLETRRLRNLTMGLRAGFQLSPSVCRLVTSEKRIKMFDGQHKAVAQILGNESEVVDCKVFIDPPLNVIRRVVMEGHGELRQQEFKTSELYKKLQSNYADELAKWRVEHPGQDISEKDLPSCLSMTPKEARQHVEADIVELITADAHCKIGEYISRERRPGNRPLTYDMYATWVRQLIKAFPVEEPMESPDNLREVERQNIIRIQNHIAEKSLIGKWTANTPESEAHKKAVNIYRRAAFRSWTRLLSNALRVTLFVDPKEAICYRVIADPDTWAKIERACEKLFEHAVWVDPSEEVAAALNSNVMKYVEEVFKKQDLNIQYLCTP